MPMYSACRVCVPEKKKAEIRFRRPCRKTGIKYSYFVNTNYTYKIYSTTLITAVAIISKYPLTDYERISLDSFEDYSEPVIYADE